MKKKAVLLALLLFFVPAVACAKGVYHTVGRGETLWRICYTYQADIKEVSAANKIKDPTQIKAGMKVFIPGAEKVLRVEPFTAGVPQGSEEDAAQLKGRLLWPVRGEVLNHFGPGVNGARRDGIEILPPETTFVRAADAGSVVYADSSFRGYGNIVIIKHESDLYTVYAKYGTTSVKEGDAVSRGEAIGMTGKEGLYFEVRRGKRPVNPFFFLP